MQYRGWLFLGVMAAQAACGAVASSYTSRYVIVDVNVIDVERGTVLTGRAVTITDDRIDKIGAQPGHDALESARQIDGRGLYLIPGLVDAHVHYFDAPIFGRLMIANGVLLVRDMGLPTDSILELRGRLNRGETLGPEMIATGAMLDGDPPVIPPIALGIKTPEDGRAAVREQVKAGVDMIKVYSRLDREAFLAIADEAQKQGVKVVGHVPDSIHIEEAAQAGLRSSEHFFGFEKAIGRLLGEPVRFHYVGMGSDAGYFQRLREIDPEQLQSTCHRLRASGLTVCPTVVTFKAGTRMKAVMAGDLTGSEYVSDGVRGMWKLLWAGQDDLPDFLWRQWMSMVKELNRAGVPLMVGTDLMLPGIIPGCSVHEEMGIWQDAGIPAADVLRSATLVPARFMGLDRRLGTITEGKTASMVLVRGNPLQDIRNVGRIEGVFLRGRYYNRANLNQLLQEAKELAQDPNDSPS